MPKQYVGPWMYGAKVLPAPDCEMEDQAGNADFGITQAPDTKTLIEWLHDAMTGKNARWRLARGRARRRVAALEQPCCHLARPDGYILLQGWRD